MPLFKEPVALESCPAKTAESVSYGATFIVLGWLLISNYFAFGSTQESKPGVATSDSFSAETVSVTDIAKIYTEKQEIAAPAGTFETSGLKEKASEETSDLLATSITEWTAWYANLGESRPSLLSRPRLRAITNADWRNTSASPTWQFTEELASGLELVFPLLDTAYVSDGISIAGSRITNDMTNSGSETPAPIREITVTGQEASRITNRPSNTHRPQIPRPFRVQEAQRALVLPPRIQALRP